MEERIQLLHLLPLTILKVFMFSHHTDNGFLALHPLPVFLQQVTMELPQWHLPLLHILHQVAMDPPVLLAPAQILVVQTNFDLMNWQEILDL
jgi:hypothetical protein